MQVSQARASEYDLVVRGGRVLDGCGNPWVYADVAIRDGRFVKVGRVEGKGFKELNAAGNYVTPGWIDMMDQSGDVLLQNGLVENKVLQGVTTSIAGEGGTAVPAGEIREYYRQVEQSGISMNFGSYYGAGQARVEVMGDVEGRPTEEQMDAMKAHVAEAMDAGALGLGTALIYPPNSFQDTEELTELAKVAASRNGIFAFHMRNESEDLLMGIQEVIDIGERSGCQVEIYHFKVAYAPGWGKFTPQAGAMIDAARTRGVNIAADMYLYDAGGTGLSITVPNWVFADGADRGMEQLKDPAVRARLKREVAAGSQPGWSNLVSACGGWDRIVLSNAFNARYDAFRSKSIAFIAKDLGQDPEDVAWDIVLAALPERAMALFFMMSEQDIEVALRWPWMSLGSDAGASLKPGEIDTLGLPHPRAYGNFPRVIAEYVKRRGVLTLEDAVRKMTSWPAARMKLFDRGVIREGMWADLTIFDYGAIADMATYENPLLYPKGITYVLVNGEVVVDRGAHTGARPGKVLRLAV